jgi:hypothetical protein
MLGTDSSFNPSSTVAEGKVAHAQFAREGKLPEMDTQMPRAAKDRQPVIAFAIQCGKITSKEVAIAIGYDDDYSIQFMGKNLLPYWKKDGATFIQALAGARDDYLALKEECKKFDEELMKDMTDAGGRYNTPNFVLWLIGIRWPDAKLLWMTMANRSCSVKRTTAMDVLVPWISFILSLQSCFSSALL